jgi:beta-N-acetylhexosaminidase
MADLSSLTLEQKVGQLFCIAFGRHSPGAQRLAKSELAGRRIDTYDDDPGQVAELVARYELGGAICFPTKDEGDDPEHIRRVVDRLQAAAPLPLLIGADQEMGTVARVRHRATSLPGAMAYAAIGAAEGLDAGLAAATTAAKITARELLAVGVTVNFAPTADVNVNPKNPVIGVRSFGSDPAEVAAYVTAQVRAYQQAGVAASAKHFPGHGDTAVDSHLDLPTITHDLATWEATDLPPFAAAIEAGVELVMTGHLALPAVDPSGDPGTVSRPILTGLLRERLGFTGVIVTDALDMAGARARYDDGELAVRALAAGVDLLLMPVDVGRAIAAVLAAVESGTLPQARIDESAARILALKSRLGVVPPAPPRLAEAADVATAHALTLRSLTVLRESAPVAGEVALVGALGRAGTPLAAGLFAADCMVTSVDCGLEPDAAQVEAAVAAAQASGRVVVVTSSAWRYPPQHVLLDALAAIGVPLTMVAVREPYDAALAPAEAGILLTYGDAAGAARAAADVLTGRGQAGGRLPVDIPDAFSRGAGL